MLIQLDKNKPFEVFMEELKNIFKNNKLHKQVQDLRELSVNSVPYMSTFLIEEAEKQENGMKLCNFKNENDRVECYNAEMTKIAKFLSVRSLREAENILTSTPYIEENYIFNFLEYTFYALVLIHPKVYRRFMLAYKLWQHTIEIGNSGYYNGSFLPYYITYFENKIIVVNPISGVINGFKRIGKLRNVGITGLFVGIECEKRMVYVKTTKNDFIPLVEENMFGSIKFLQLVHEMGTDMREAERESKKQAGKQVKETAWITTQLEKYDGSLYTIRNHILIALMVHNIHCMKFGLMENNSIFTIDHIDGIHKNNCIQNLQLLTRSDNERKKENEKVGIFNEFYFNFFDYWEQQLEKSKIIQYNYNFRKNSK